MANRRLLSIVLSAVAGVAGTLALGQPAAASGPPPVTVYAAPRADAPPGNPCTRPRPCSLSQAQQRVRHLLRTGAGARRDIVLKLAGGSYYLSAPLAFGPQDSGRNGHTVTWQQATDAAVTISGGRPLRPAWQPAAPGSKIMAATVPAGLDFDGLFVNGQRQILARYPNYDPDAARLQGSVSLADLGRESAKWSNPSTALVRAMHCGDWGSVSFTVSGRTGDGLALHYVGDNNRPRDCGLTKGNGPGRIGPAMAENVKEELDAPGEWFYERTSGRLLYYPPEGTDLSAATVETAEQDQLITLAGTSPANPVHDITLRGLHFAATHRTLFDSTFEADAKGDWAVVRKGAVHLKNAADIAVTGSFFDQLGGNGVFLDGYTKHNTVSDNKFESDGATDVQIVGSPSAVRDYSGNYDDTVSVSDTAPGPKTDDYPRDIVVRNNRMRSMGRFEKQSSGVNISMSANVTVDGNTISDSPRACLNIEDGTWGGHDIKNNDLFDCVKETGDNGSVNVWGRGRFWASSGNNTLAPGTSFEGSTGTALTDAQARHLMKRDVVRPITVQHNRFWHAGDWAIDLDDGSSDFRLLDNLILKGGIKLRDGYERTVRNNLLVDGSIYEQVSHSGCGDVIEHNITLGPQAYSNVLNNPSTAQYGVDRNLFWNDHYPVYVNPDGSGNEALSADGATINPQSAWVRAGMDPHSLVADPEFTAADPTASYDFTVASGSPAVSLGYANFPMTGFGAAGGPLPPKAAFAYGPGSGGPANGLIVQPEMLMGAAATNIPSLAVQSSLGLTKPYGLYLTSVPEGSYAAQHGLRTGDDITAVNGTSVTDDRNTFWLSYNKLAPGAPITLTVRRGQADVTVRLGKTLGSELLNNTSGVVYTTAGSPSTGWIWRGKTAGGANSYLDDIWATQNAGDSWSLTFSGTGIDIISETNTDEGDVDLTLDGAPDRTVSFVTPAREYQSTVATISGLRPGVHTVTGTMKNGSYLIVDAFRTHP